MLEVEPLTECIGACVTGVDLRESVDPAMAGALDRALQQHLVLVIPGQRLEAEQYRDAMSCFGEVMKQHRAKFNMEAVPEVGTVDNFRGFPPASMWHTDHTNHRRPPKITALYGVEIPARGGDTAFASMYAALSVLPAEERNQLARMCTINEMEDNATYSDADRAKYPGGVRHPMVRMHPQTGNPAMYFHVGKSQGIEGMDSVKVRGYLESLLKRTIGPEIVYRHQWRRGDVVICDNRCTMHRVHADFDNAEHRLLWRVIIRGEQPVGLTD